MLKKGGIFLGILLSFTTVFAQDKTADLFRHDNPNLMNLNEPKEYTGEPLVYIEGVKAPEVAHTDMEALQLKLFGTKNVQEATKSSLKLSKNTLPQNRNQVENFVMHTPFHGTIKAGFIHHIPSFVATILVLNRDQILISEDVTLMNTDQDKIWERHIPLPPNATAHLISYTQNGNTSALDTAIETPGLLSFKATTPLLTGPNQLNLTYQVNHPFQKNILNLDLTGLDLEWPIERFNVFTVLPTSVKFEVNKLLFGTNKLEIPDIYTQKTDDKANTTFSINRIVPPNASIQVMMQFDTTQLPLPESDNRLSYTVLFGFALLILYYGLFIYWTRRPTMHLKPAKIKIPQNVLILAKQIGTSITPEKWHQIYSFYQKNAWKTDALRAQQLAWQEHPQKMQILTRLQNFFWLMAEPIIGTILLITGIVFTLALVEKSISAIVLIALMAVAALGLWLVYHTGVKPARRTYWKQTLYHFSQRSTLIGITQQQVHQIYPLFVLCQKHEDWRKQMIQLSPKLAQTVHLR